MHVPLPTVSDHELAKPRSQEELHRFFCETLEKFAETPEGKRAVRLNSEPNLKKFTEEILPLSQFADAFYCGAADALFNVELGTGSADAIITDQNGSTSEHLQITLANMDYQARLQLEHLQKFGCAPATGAKFSRDETGSVPRTSGAAESHDAILDAQLERLRMAVERKASKGYEDNTSLIVHYEATYYSEDDLDRIDDFANTVLAPLCRRYNKLYLVCGKEGFNRAYETKAT